MCRIRRAMRVAPPTQISVWRMTIRYGSMNMTRDFTGIYLHRPIRWGDSIHTTVVLLVGGVYPCGQCGGLWSVWWTVVSVMD